jgi:hypothetical protein
MSAGVLIQIKAAAIVPAAGWWMLQTSPVTRHRHGQARMLLKHADSRMPLRRTADTEHLTVNSGDHD